MVRNWVHSSSTWEHSKGICFQSKQLGSSGQCNRQEKVVEGVPTANQVAPVCRWNDCLYRISMERSVGSSQCCWAELATTRLALSREAPLFWPRAKWLTSSESQALGSEGQCWGLNLALSTQWVETFPLRHTHNTGRVTKTKPLTKKEKKRRLLSHDSGGDILPKWLVSPNTEAQVKQENKTRCLQNCVTAESWCCGYWKRWNSRQIIKKKKRHLPTDPDS